MDDGGGDEEGGWGAEGGEGVGEVVVGFVGEAVHEDCHGGGGEVVGVGGADGEVVGCAGDGLNDEAWGWLSGDEVKVVWLRGRCTEIFFSNLAWGEMTEVWRKLGSSKDRCSGFVSQHSRIHFWYPCKRCNARVCRCR